MPIPLTIDVDPAGAEGAAARPPRRRPAPGDRHRSGRASSATTASRPPTPTSSRRWFRRGADRNEPRALPRDLRAHRRRDADSATPSSASPPSAPRTWPPTASSTPRSASRPSCTPRQGLSLDEVVEAVLDGLPRRRSAGTRPSTIGSHRSRPCASAARSVEIAELAVRYRDAGRRRLRHRRPRGRLPADAPPRRVPAHPAGELPLRPSTPARRSACRRSGRRCSGAAPNGWATACASSTTSPSATTARSAGPAGRYVRDRRVPLEMCPTSNVHTGAVAVDRGASDRAAAAAALPGHRQHRQPADERRVHDLRVRRAARRFGFGLDEMQWLTLNAMKSAFAPFDERLRLSTASSSRATPNCVEARYEARAMMPN